MKAGILFNSCMVLFVIVLSPVFCTGDTGTYEIEDYAVTLAPKENGVVKITYNQKWRVTGGTIPWVTVGMANSNFALLHEKTGRNISDIKKRNSGSWSGVYISLDKKYEPGETFEIEFAVLQSDLFYGKGRNYLLHYIPGWYDRGMIHHLTVKLDFFTNLDGVSSKPEPDLAESRSLLWERNKLKKGSQFPISISFPEKLFPEKIHLNSNKNKRASEPNSAWGGIISIALVFVVMIAVMVIFARASIKHNYGSGGKISTGGRTGTSGTGHVVSCACACVACACACACAGGGAAGCDRKLTFSCPLCKECNNEDCPILRKRI